MERPISFQQVVDTSCLEQPLLSPKSEQNSLVTWTRPLLRPLGSLLQHTGDGGSSKEYDSWDKNRA